MTIILILLVNVKFKYLFDTVYNSTFFDITIVLEKKTYILNTKGYYVIRCF